VATLAVTGSLLFAAAYRLIRLPDRPSNRSGLTPRNAISGKQRYQTNDADSAKSDWLAHAAYPRAKPLLQEYWNLSISRRPSYAVVRSRRVIFFEPLIPACH
jgi:hypothetical protein